MHPPRSPERSESGVGPRPGLCSSTPIPDCQTFFQFQASHAREAGPFPLERPGSEAERAAHTKLPSLSSWLASSGDRADDTLPRYAIPAVRGLREPNPDVYTEPVGQTFPLAQPRTSRLYPARELKGPIRANESALGYIDAADAGGDSVAVPCEGLSSESAQPMISKVSSIP